MQGLAFVGVSLDSILFSRDWVRSALRYILSKHSGVEFVIGDRLLAFNKSTHRNDDGTLVINLSDAEARIAKRTNDVYQFLVSEVSRLTADEQSRVTISQWDAYSDAHFVNIARILTIAYWTLNRFQQCVDGDVETHLMNLTKSQHPPDVHRRLCALYVIEETAMIIRITESGRPFEYYPQQHINTLTEIYKDSFSEFGLTVESLVGHERRRHFVPLPLFELPISRVATSIQSRQS